MIKTQRDHSAVQTKSINRLTKQGYWNTEALNVLTGLSVLAYPSLPEKSQCKNCAVGSNESNMQVTFIPSNVILYLRWSLWTCNPGNPTFQVSYFCS